VLFRSPGFAITALAALALGVGANTAIFSVVNAVLLKPLTYPDPGRIVQFLMNAPAGPDYGGSATRFNVLRGQHEAFADVSAYEYNGIGLNLTGNAFPEQIHAIHVSAGYFHLFGAPIVQGRAFTDDEDRPGGVRVVVLSYGLWQRSFGGDPRITGKTISLSGSPYTVVGIVGSGFETELDSPPEVWLPFQIDPNSNDHARYFNIVGRLKPGMTASAANAQLQIASDEFRRQFPTMIGPRDSFGIHPFQDAIVSDVRPSLLVLAAAVGFVLLIACANVANLLLIRITGRGHEIAVRAAMGAGRARIARQLLTESLMLSITGSALGLFLGLTGVRALLAIYPGDIPRIGEHGSAIALDWRVLSFTLVVSLLTCVLFGLTPALQASRADLSLALRESGSRSGTGLRANRSRSLLVISETALALMLLVAAALFIRTSVALRTVDPGFDAHNVLTMRMSLAGSRFGKTSEVDQMVRNATDRIEALPGVVEAGVAYTLPLEGGFGIPFNIVGRRPIDGRYDGRGWLGVSPGYFDIFRIPVLRGRSFTDRDEAGAEPVVIINQAMARQFWPQGDPLAGHIVLGQGYGPEFEEPARRIIGVVRDIHDTGLNRNPAPMAYVPMAQITDGITALAKRALSLAWLVRTQREPLALRAAVQNELQQATGGLPVASVRSMEEVVSQSTARQDFDAILMLIFGSLALVLAAIGIYGLMAYSVQQRRREIGIRLALGADRRDVRNMVVSQGMRLALIGVVIGTSASFGLTRLLASFLFRVQARDPLVFIGVPLLLSVVALLAVWLPARRATRVSPMDALRCE
jgi:putative ABC transport system permease protein